MSLLLEALKKAERAKEEAQRQSGGGAAKGELQLESAAPAEARHVVTRDELPDISKPMEILSEDIGQESPVAETPRRAANAAAASARSAASKPAPSEPAAAERVVAKKVFEAKFREPNPKLPFYIVMGCLVAFAVGTVGYFWYQLRPPPPMVNANPPKPSGEKIAAVPVSKPAPAVPDPAAATPQSQVPGLPEAKPAVAVPPGPAASASAPTAPAVPAVAAPAKPAPVLPAKPAAAAAAPAMKADKPAAVATPRQVRPAVAVRRAEPAVDPSVESAYRAYGSGDLTAARSGYEQALRADAANRDALLGLAAVEVRSQNFAAAEALYARLLRMDPRDTHAQAGSIALRGQSADPVAVESRVKSMLASDPESGALHFTLANQLAQQARWAEAQQSYFKAVTAEPDNADFAYNLAVSLDHLRKPNLALEYYRRALALADKRGAAFDRAAVQARVQQLGR